MSHLSAVYRCLLAGVLILGACDFGGEITGEPTAPATPAAPQPESTAPLVAECSGTPGEWQGCRGHGCSVCGEVTAQYPYYFVNHPLCDRNLTCDGDFYTCNANCPPPSEGDKEPNAGQCNGTPGQWQGCRGNGCSVCAEKLTAYPYYFLRHPKCLKNTTCAGQFFTCNADCPAPTAADQSPPAGTCGGTTGQWQGCRGNGCSVCAEKLTDYPAYFLNHPNCVKNTTCAGLFFTCNSNCPAPTDADRIVLPAAPNPAPSIKDMPGQNTALSVEASSGVFRIKTLPTTTFNIINVVIATNDGKPLEGQLQAGASILNLQGTSQTVMFRERSKQPVVFALSLPSVRKVKLTWSVANRVPLSKTVARTTSTASGVVTAKYGFAADHAVDADLTLKFTASNFTDGQAPTIKRFEHNPQGVRYPDRPDDLFGPTYDISAKPKSGKRTQVALPVPEVALLRGLDEATLTVMHYNATTKVWSEITPDRIAGGYVYFTTTSFSNFFTRMARRTKNLAGDVVSGAADVVVAVGETVATIADGLKDTAKDMYKALVSGACSLLEIKTYKNLIEGRPRYNPPKLDLTDAMKAPRAEDLIELQRLVEQAVWGPNQNQLSSLVELTTDPARSVAQNELAQWGISSANAELLMADVILAARPGATRRFSPKLTTATLAIPLVPGARIIFPTGYVIHDAKKNVGYAPTKLFRFSSALLAASPRVLELLVECGGMFGLGDEFSHTVGHVVDGLKELTQGDLGQACREALMLPADALDWATPDAVTCAIEAGSFKDYYGQKKLDQYFGGDRDKHVLQASQFLNRITVLLWADPKFRDVWERGATGLRDQMHSFAGLTHEMYGNGNIPIKNMAGVALWDMVSQGKKATYNTLKSWLEAKSGESGGYAEGTGYLQYINDDVPYLFAAMLRGGLITRADLPKKYLKSAEWLMAASPLKSSRPIETDDGVTHLTDFRLYAYLTGDGRYLSLDAGAPGVSIALRPLGVTAALLPVSAAAVLPDVSFSDGIGMVRVKGAGGSPTAALSVIAESGLMRTAGDGHDQQDNGSVTLSHATLGDILVDPGYNGFSARHANPCLSPAGTPCLGARFDAHNVVMTAEPADFHGEKPNGLLTYGDISRVLSKQPNVHNLSWAKAEFTVVGGLVFIFTSGRNYPGFDWSIWNEDAAWGDPGKQIDAHAGGADAALLGPLINDLPGFAAHGLEVKHTSTAAVTNRRFLASFADQLWIIDRPDARRSLWSRLNWAEPTTGTPFFSNAFQIPGGAPLAGDLTLTWPQNAGDPRPLRQRTHVAGSTADAAVFLTAVPVAANTASPFTEVACDNAVCAQRGTPATAQDVVIIPRWGRQFSDCRFFQGLVKTGQIVLAHRDAGSQTWTLRLLGDQPAALAATSLGAQVSHRSDVLYQIAPAGTVQAVFPNGTRQTLAVTSTCQSGCSAPINDQWNQGLGGSSLWTGVWGDPVVDVASNRLRLSMDDVVQRTTTLPGSYHVTYQLTLSGGTIFTPAVYEQGTILPSIRRSGSDMQLGGASYGAAWSDVEPAAFAGVRVNGALTATVTTYVKAQSRQMAMRVQVGSDVYRSGWSAPMTWAQTNTSILRFIGQNLPVMHPSGNDHLFVGPLTGCAGYTDAEIQAQYNPP